MKQIKNINPLSTLTTQDGQNQTRSEPSSDENVVNQIFSDICAIKPAWQTQIKDQRAVREVKLQWLQGFKESGITDIDVIKRGLAAARADTSPFLPTVGQFIEWCSPKVEAQHRAIELADQEYRANQKKLTLGTREDRVKTASEHIKKAREALKL